jgi:heat shock protein HslJ
MFRSMADAPRFRDCRSGLEWPVAMAEDYAALERAYTAQRGEPGGELLVSIDARIEQRPRMEGEGTEATLVVEKFLHAKPGENCAGRIAPGRATQEELLGNTRWVPIRIGDHAMTVASGQREPWIELEPRSRGVTGSGGCNRFTGGYESGEGTLRFDAVASTQMACASTRTETEFLLALEATRRFRVHGRTLELIDEHGRVLVRLEERNLK